MLIKIDYRRVLELTSYTVALADKYKSALYNYLLVLPSPNDVNMSKGIIRLVDLSKYLKDHRLFENFTNELLDDEVPLDVYLCLYVILNINAEKSTTDNEVLETLKEDKLYKELHHLHDWLAFYSLVTSNAFKQKTWSDFTKTFDAKNWDEIFILAEISPISNIKLDEFISWISLLIEEQRRDGALGTIAQYIYEWVVFNEHIVKDIDLKLIEIATNNTINRFFPPLLRGLRDKQKNKNTYYILRLKDKIEQPNSYNILFAIGNISLEDDDSANIYYELLVEKLNEKKLFVHAFISLCRFFQFNRKELFESIEINLPSSVDTEVLFSIIGLLQNDKEKKINEDWKRKTCFILFSKHAVDIRSGLDACLYSIADTSLPLAYDLFEFRLKVMAHLEFLDDSFVHMVQKTLSYSKLNLSNGLVKKMIICILRFAKFAPYTNLEKVCLIYLNQFLKNIMIEINYTFHIKLFDTFIRWNPYKD